MPQTYQQPYDFYARSGSWSKENLFRINQCVRSGVWLYDATDVLGMKGSAFLCRQWHGSIDRHGGQSRTTSSKS